MDNYKPNSHKSKEEISSDRPPVKKVEKAISGSVKTKKRNEIRKIADAFISEDAENVKSYILSEVLIPAIKKAIDDMFTSGIKMILWGERGNRSDNLKSSSLSYHSYYDKKDDQRYRDSSSNRDGYNYNDIIFDNRGEAEEVLYKMDELISMYEVVSVADLYDLVGIDGKYTDNRYGWKDIRNASVIHTRDGYMIKLPKALPLT